MVKRLGLAGFVVCSLLFGSDLICLGDTLTHRQTGQVLHGYATSRVSDGHRFVQTQQKGLIKLNLGEWEMVSDRKGRNNKVVVLIIDESMILEIETEAIEAALARGVDEGPLFILVEIDTPGGNVSFAQRICSAINQTVGCEVIGFIKAGEHGGAISAGTAVAFACDKIYVANNTIIGAATPMVISGGSAKGVKKAFGEAVGEKISSAWQAKLASLAEQDGRSALLARAMVDKEIEVIEVSERSKRLFIEPVNKKPEHKLLRTWSKKGSLLTLTAEEAVRCNMADKIANSRTEVLRDLEAGGAELMVYTDGQDARGELRKARLKLERLRKSIDLKIKQSQLPQPMPKVLQILRGARNDYKEAVKLAKRYPDLKLDVKTLENQLNSVEALYENARLGTKRRR